MRSARKKRDWRWRSARSPFCRLRQKQAHGCDATTRVVRLIQERRRADSMGGPQPFAPRARNWHDAEPALCHHIGETDRFGGRAHATLLVHNSDSSWWMYTPGLSALKVKLPFSRGMTWVTAAPPPGPVT